MNTNFVPYQTVVRITDRQGSTDVQGSGVLIAPDEVLTASHMVWSSADGQATNIVVAPDYQQDAPYGTANGTVTHYYTVNDGSGFLTLSQIQNDFAVIHLDHAFDVGTMGLGADYPGGNVTVSGYPGSADGLQVNTPESVSVAPNYSVLLGTSIGAGSSGGPIWTTDSSGQPYVEGVVSAGDADGTGYFARLTDATRSQIENWMAQDETPSVPLVAGYVDANGNQGTAPLQAATGGPSYLRWEYIWPNAQGVSLSTMAPNTFLHGGPGEDSIEVTSGQNILDGGAGSNFLIGAPGADGGMDTFFLDGRGGAATWDTIVNFHAGDAVT
ncbi:MAG: trypsin-like peptidase domain-containing protein, partial [Acetobacteraceae bacterium]|nr:trypsin-like peptidase domain-containing protein [Acetobacteraceae bacterium]